MAKKRRREAAAVKAFTEAELLGRLARKHAAPEWAYFTHVRNTTGFSRKVRTADAIAMSLWPSRGLELHGFEVKVARGDWLKEMRTPAKAEAIGQFCHRWWLVTSPGIVQAGELPPSWGLIEPHTRGLTVKKQAERMDAKPPTMAFLSGLLRKAGETMVPLDSIKDQLAERYKAGQDAAGWQSKTLKENHKRLVAIVNVFEKASGVKIASYGGEETARQMGEAVKFFTRNRGDLAQKLRMARNHVKGLIEQMEKVIEEFEKDVDQVDA